MRNIEECMAEISRRSGEIFKQRKRRRKHILMACIPLVLLIGMYTAFILPAMMPAGSAAPESENAEDDLYAGTKETGMVAFSGSIEVSGMGISHYYNSSETVTRITGIISRILAAPEADDEEVRDFMTSASAFINEDDAFKEKGYKIIITRSDGTSTAYFLLENMLIDQNTKEIFSLEEKVCFELKDALGIPCD